MSNYSSETLGFIVGSANLVGYAKNLFVSTTEVLIPLIGENLGAPNNLHGFSVLGSVIINLSEQVPDTITTDGSTDAIILAVKNITQSAVLGHIVIGVGGISGSANGSLSINSGDQVALSVVATGGSARLPFLTWSIS